MDGRETRGTIYLGDGSSAEEVYAAMRQAASPTRALPESYPDGLEVKASSASDSKYGTDWETRVDATVYEVTWETDLPGETVRTGRAVVDRWLTELDEETGGLSSLARWVVALPKDRAEVDALLLLALRGHLPGVAVVDEP